MIDLEKNIKLFLKERNLGVREFCEVLKMTTPNLYKIYARGSIDTEYLEKVSKKWDVPIWYLLIDKNEHENQTKVRQDVNESLRNENEMLRDGIKTLKDLVKTKDELIKQLKKSK